MPAVLDANTRWCRANTTPGTQIPALSATRSASGLRAVVPPTEFPRTLPSVCERGKPKISLRLCEMTGLSRMCRESDRQIEHAYLWQT